MTSLNFKIYYTQCSLLDDEWCIDLQVVFLVTLHQKLILDCWLVLQTVLQNQKTALNLQKSEHEFPSRSLTSTYGRKCKIIQNIHNAYVALKRKLLLHISQCSIQQTNQIGNHMRTRHDNNKWCKAIHIGQKLSVLGLVHIIIFSAGAFVRPVQRFVWLVTGQIISHHMIIPSPENRHNMRIRVALRLWLRKITVNPSQQFSLGRNDNAAKPCAIQ